MAALTGSTVVGLAIVVGLLLGAVLIMVAFPAFEQSGATAVVPRPAPSPTSTLVPTPSPDFVMGAAVIHAYHSQASAQRRVAAAAVAVSPSTSGCPAEPWPPNRKRAP